MEIELIKKAAAIFDTPEKWVSFLELEKKKQSIIDDIWYKKLFDELIYNFSKIDLVDGWNFYEDDWNLYWYLELFGKNSICLKFVWNGYFSLANETRKEISSKDEVNNLCLLIKTHCFQRVDKNYWGNDIYAEEFNLSFGTSLDGNFNDSNILAWYAGNRTDEFVKQIQEKVNRFRKDEIITQQLIELNEFVIKL